MANRDVEALCARSSNEIVVANGIAIFITLVAVFEDAFVHSAWVFQAQKILEDSAKNVNVKGALKRSVVISSN